MGSLKDIVNGWKAYAIKDPVALELARERAKVCSGCDRKTESSFEVFLPDYELKEVRGLKCTVCSCPLSTATRSKDYSCPLGKW